MHSNGFSLVRKVFNVEKNDLTMYSDELGMTLGEALLTPTKIYVKPVLKLMESVSVRAIAHITGGGFYENIPRCLKPGMMASIDSASLRILPIFKMIQTVGQIPMRDMYNTFNMGVGLCVAVAADQADEAVRAVAAAGEKAVVLGEVVAGEDGIVLC